MGGMSLPYRDQSPRKPGFWDAVVYMSVPSLILAVIVWIYLPASQETEVYDWHCHGLCHFHQSLREIGHARDILRELRPGLPCSGARVKSLAHHLDRALAESERLSGYELYEVNSHLPGKYFGQLIPAVEKILSGLENRNRQLLELGDREVRDWYLWYEDSVLTELASF